MHKDHLPNQIVREVIARVAAGRYPRGRRLPAERSLCAELAVARGTLRRALSELERLGVLEIRPNSGVYVRELPAARLLPQSLLPEGIERLELDDIIDARKAIELAAVRQAAGQITVRQVAELRRLLERMAARIDDLPEFLDLDMAFHRAIVRASGNAVLVTAFEATEQYHRFSAIYTSQQAGEEQQAQRHHRLLVAALADHDGPGACRILARHLEALRKYSRRPGRRRAVRPA